VDAIPGVRTYFQNPPLIRIGGQQSRSLYQYTLQADNLNDLNEWVPRMLAKMRTLKGLVDLNSDQQN